MIGVVQNIKYFDNAKYLDEAADGIRQSDRLDADLDSRKIVQETPSGVCFVAGTLIVTDRGLVEIENIKSGDIVYSKDESTGEEGYKSVVRTIIRTAYLITKITLSNGEVIETTNEHPFGVINKGWIEAGELLKEDELYFYDQDQIRIKDIERLKIEEGITVYNFEVKDYHTYFVGNSGVWVHNNNGCFKNGDVIEGTRQTIKWTGDSFDDIAKNSTPDELISRLENLGWEKIIEVGGKKSDPATIFIDPTTRTKVRIHSTPGEGIPYFRVQNAGGGYLDSLEHSQAMQPNKN